MSGRARDAHRVVTHPSKTAKGGATGGAIRTDQDNYALDNAFTLIEGIPPARLLQFSLPSLFLSR